MNHPITAIQDIMRRDLAIIDGVLHIRIYGANGSFYWEPIQTFKTPLEAHVAANPPRSAE